MENKRRISLVESDRCLWGGWGSTFVCVLFLLCVFAAPVLAQEDPLREAGESFVSLLDAGYYQQAWWEGSELLHKTSNLDQWVEKIRTQRELFGAFKGRSVKNIAMRAGLPGLPDGQYAVLLFNCRFENKQKGLEVMTLGKDPYGTWKVISYRFQ